MKTIKQIADELGVTKQAVFYRIKKPPLSNALQSLATKENGVLMVSFDGETLIKQAFSADAVKEFGDKEPSKENIAFDDDTTKDNLIMSLIKQNAALNIELSKEREHSREIANKLAKLTENAQTLHLGTMQKNLLPEASDGEQKRRGFFGWLHRDKDTNS